MLKFRVFYLADTELTCLPERKHKQCLREGLFHSMFILFSLGSTGNIYKYKGKYLLRRIPHASKGSKLQSFRY